MVHIPQTHKKLREAEFFLEHLLTKERGTERGLHIKPESFSFYLSAFLNASLSTKWVLRAEFLQVVQNKQKKNRRRKWVENWFCTWEKGLTANERELWEFMDTQRGKEVHVRGAEVKAETEYVPVTEMDTGDEVFWCGLPGMPPPKVGRRIHYFELGSAAEKTTETCRRYLELLERFVHDFEQSQPI